MIKGWKKQREKSNKYIDILNKVKYCDYYRG